MQDTKTIQSSINLDPEKALDQGLQIVKQQSYYMRSALDTGNLRQALKFSSGMLNELRSAVLTPRLYYQLYVSVFDQLRTLESYFAEQHRAGRKMATVYQKVQHASNIVPRLYLLITVGAAYIESREAPAHQILKDLLQMVKGVQHPIHGLFLRYYLLKTMKEKLPDKGTPYEGEGGDIDDAVTFILSNLSEMNRLWVRLGYIGGASQKQKREMERKELRVTVGENIIRLSSLEGLSLQIYESSVQPKVLQIITACKDALAQQYLMDCMIQAFPDDYHLHTLDQLLDATTNLLPSVDSASIFVNLIQKLTMFSANSQSSVQDLLEQKSIFQLLQKYTKRFMQAPSEDNINNTSLKKLLQLLVSLIRFSIKSFPMKTQYVNEILQSAIDVVRQRSKVDLVDNKDCLKLLQELLSIPLATLSLAILEMNQYPHLMQYLTFEMRRQVSNGIVTALLKSKKTIDSSHTLQQLLEFITPLLKDQDDYVDCEVEQERVSKLIHIINYNELEQAYNILQLFKERFLDGGDKRKIFTIPALIFGFIKYSIRLDKAMMYNEKISYQYQQPDSAQQSGQVIEMQQHNDLEDEPGQQKKQADESQKKQQNPAQKTIEIPQNVSVLQIYELIAKILPQITQKFPEITLRLYLQSLQALSSLEHLIQIQEEKVQHMAYDLASQAFTIYQDELSESQSKFNAINLIIATFSTINCLSSDDYDTLAKNATQYAAKQLKKPTQSEAVLQASHLFWNDFIKSEDLVLQCLQRSNSIANVCLANPRNLFLLVKLLDKYLYFFANDVPKLAAENVNTIVENLNKQIGKITGDIGNADASLKESFKETKMHYQETVRAIQMRTSMQTKYGKINFDY